MAPTAATLTVELGADETLVVDAEPLTAEAFAPFGDVIANPRPDLHPSSVAADHGEAAAAKTNRDLPANAVSANQGTAIQYRYVSRVRNLYAQAPSGGPGEPLMSVFVCAARGALDDDGADEDDGGPQSRRASMAVRYLERHPFTTQTFSPLASSATTYLVVLCESGMLGARGTALSFAVSQFASGVGLEDCQLVELVSSGRTGPRVRMRMPRSGEVRGRL
ncbi:hypothetical protein HIM_01017 [Hirsutella minnesotensis 3608]|nr:hypothetical protein HIM_01017 [Hirsutella minnesotensis 3608]